jgi:hypothetical protein
VISTRNLNLLPDVKQLRRLLQSMAMLDAILCREWEFRYYSFNSKWAVGEELGSMRNGQGDQFFALFNAAGCFIKGFDHEAEMSPFRSSPDRVWPGVLESVPEEFAACLTEPAFAINETTFCTWRRHYETEWQIGDIAFPTCDDPDGSEYLLSALDGRPETYRNWAVAYFNKPFLTVEMVQHLYEQRPLTNELIAVLTQDIIIEDEGNPHLMVADLEDDIQEIGYPT